MSSARRGFTLIEVLAVVLLTSIVIGVALDFYVDLSRASSRASEHTRDVRHATAILDRIARDFEAAVLVKKPAEVDPIEHPWLFFAESRYASSGSDHIKFVTRNHQPRRSDAHESDLAVVAYTVRRDEDDRLDLLRWSSPRLPESLDRSFPRDGAMLMAEGLASFEVSFLGDDGQWSGTWDSTTLEESSELPRAVEIRVAMAGGEGVELEEARSFDRRVLLPVRPLDLEVLLDPRLAAGRGRSAEEEAEEEGEGAAGESEEGGGREEAGTSQESAVNDCSDPSSPIQAKTVLQCVNPAVLGPRIEEYRAMFKAYLGRPFCDYQRFIPPILVHRSCR